MFANKIHEEAQKAFEKGDYKLAIAGYTKALEEAENNCIILSDRAVAYLHLNEKEKSLADFDLAVQLQPEYAFRYSSRAYAKKHFNDIDGAIEDYEIAIDLDPNDDISQNNLGVILEEMGAQQEAKTHYDKSDVLRESKETKPESPTINNEVVPESKQEVEVEKLSDEEIDTKTEELKKIFSSKKQFSEFMHFIKNGFKIK